jgi:CYTH domain-containing protein
VGRCARRRRAVTAPQTEIERRFLLSAAPAVLDEWPITRLEQGYLPGTRLIERVRRAVHPDGRSEYTRTVKLGSGIERIEVEEGTDEATFTVLWSLTAGRRIVKRRHRVPSGGLLWEVDVFEDRPLVLAEVELPSVETPVALPDWLTSVLVCEVTDDGRFTNAALSQHTTVPDPRHPA